jgi:broad specificity phosphatase PhoE
LTDIYLIRHAQAGTRENYDVLSELGRKQARLLGEFLAQQKIAFRGIYSGGMQRQQETARIVSDVVSGSGNAPPEIQVDERWNELSLLSLYRGIGTRMLSDSLEFSRDFAEMQEALSSDPHTTRGATGRCDSAVIRAWMENRYPEYDGESWRSFRDRIQGILSEFPGGEEPDSIAVFTSATPIAILTGAALDLTDQKLIGILGVIGNTSITVMRAASELRLFSFNSTPHLNAATRTYR